ncbi:MAG: 30S ribosomal protein S14 type Z [Candidatus Levybacteria bacterium RIFCSPHIGHO2_12_FULL_38_12]|nr:MAG: 30S ribosomal protein S14 type Z [Candidatus Levybacteria bacterium RIFCSPHIGHO2_01_FULL_38_12]OGH21961.1 MAG: 30S ribosomal protein S14 type Z [Candidatus Levybacteria bacterium RIFCSPHIGHO2_02_FULL_37_18]OGH23033.1 MAG: 30S ribosomal protein S14 type Z [Candidatus Levybacteria bacterium RIFCSPHIGHO2_12_FULL_38_12]OGH33740.1 MAG: 30S ribosomal protein S14 type Z [Candidatus Levybacteria bacterium RIFCSPLOWO2_01_FULL_37_20]OGH44560.1 MAG: 30S ribosomal protein S14 type Z [Candidatus Lev
MAKVSSIVKFKKRQKYSVRNKNRCNLCGRARGYMRRFGICRICFRELAAKGELPGVVKATW